MLAMSAGTVALFVRNGVREPVTLFLAGSTVLVVMWLFFVVIDFIPAWTVIVAILLASASVATKLFSRNYMQMGGG